MARLATQEHSEDSSPEYWWQVCRGAEVMQAFCAAPESEAWNVVHQHPVLLLPELVDAAEQMLGASYATAGLRQMQRSLRGTPYFAPFHRQLVTALSRARGGSPVTNLQRALAVMSEVRAAAPESDRAADDHTWHAIRAALEELLVADAAPAPAAAAAPVVAAAAAPVAATAADPTMARLFLDDDELPGFLRCHDRRGARADLADRMLASLGGTFAGSVEWSGNDEWPVHRVVDTRWLFPSIKAAKAYLESPTTLSSAGEQLPRVSVPAIGDGAYAWGVSHPGRALERPSQQIVLFRVGRVVGKLHVTEGPRAPHVFQRLSQDMLLPYAQAAVRRAHWALSQYWLAIARASEAVTRFVQAPPRTASSLFAEFPILLLPELPTAMAALGQPHRAAAERLIGLHGTLKNDWHAYRGVLRSLVRALLDEPSGDARVNADAALELVIAHRRLDSDFSWAAIETECRAHARIADDRGRRAA